MISSLPSEMLTYIHSFIESPRDMAQCALVCKLWNAAFDENWWKQKAASLPEDEVEYTLLPDYKAVFKDWWTFDRKIHQIMTPVTTTLPSPFNNKEGMRKIVRHMFGKKRYDETFFCSLENHPNPDNIPMESHSLARYTDLYNRHFFAVQYTLNDLSTHICTFGEVNGNWEFFGVVNPPSSSLLESKVPFETVSYHFYKTLIREGRAQYTIYDRHNTFKTRSATCFKTLSSE